MAHDNLTARGIAALRSGAHAEARALLAAAVRADPANATAWLWLAGAAPDAEARRYCLERVLALDPSSAPARAGLATLRDDQRAGTIGHPEHAAGPTQADRQAVAKTRAYAEPSLPDQLSPPSPSGERPAVVGAVVGDRPAPADARGSAYDQTGYVNPWLAIWTRPRAAMRSAIAMRVTLETWLLAGLAGVSMLLAWTAWGGLGDELRQAEILVVVMLAGPPLGIVLLLMGGVLLRTGGQLVGGRAGAGRVRAALAWAAVPVIAGLLLWAVVIALAPTATFGRALTPAQRLLTYAAGGLQLALWVWAAVLSVIGLAEAHRFSLVRAVASWLMALLIVVGALAALFGGAVVVIGLRGG